MGLFGRKKRKPKPFEPIRVCFTPEEVSQDALIDLFVCLQQHYKQEGGENLRLEWDEGYGGGQFMAYKVVPTDDNRDAYERFEVKAAIEVKRFSLRMR